MDELEVFCKWIISQLKDIDIEDLTEFELKLLKKTGQTIAKIEYHKGFAK